jgi:hypothetical protein
MQPTHGEFILTFSSDAVLYRKIFDYVLHWRFSLLTYYSTPRVSAGCYNATNVIAEIDRTPIRSEQNLLNSCPLHNFQLELYMNTCGDKQGGHWRMWQNARGYIENDCVFHLDAMFNIDLTTQSSEMFVKMITHLFYLEHEKISQKTRALMFFNDDHIQHAKSDCYSYTITYPRDQRGLRATPSYRPLLS